MSAREIREFYRSLGGRMFRRPPLRRRFWYRYESRPVRNASTDSPWPLSNNTGATFNDPSLPDCNLKLPLWQLGRVSTAAPVYFPAERITLGSRTFTFVDGGVSRLTPHDQRAPQSIELPAAWAASVPVPTAIAPTRSPATRKTTLPRR